MCVGVTDETAAGWLPKSTRTCPLNPRPVSVTSVPPWGAPKFGVAACTATDGPGNGLLGLQLAAVPAVAARNRMTARNSNDFVTRHARFLAGAKGTTPIRATAERFRSGR